MAERGWVRIIGGEWRGRKIKVPEEKDLRPTPDRVRETLFNWLAPYIQGAYCLDPFAGSGALGFEALSRGAAYLVMIDQSRVVVKLLQEEIALFKATDRALIYSAETPAGILPSQKPFDIVFLDPPFQQKSLLPTCFYLEEKGLLARDAFIYLETSNVLDEKQLPASWQIIKSKKAGQVAYHLVRRQC